MLPSLKGWYILVEKWFTKVLLRSVCVLRLQKKEAINSYFEQTLTRFVRISF